VILGNPKEDKSGLENGRNFLHQLYEYKTLFFRERELSAKKKGETELQKLSRTNLEIITKRDNNTQIVNLNEGEVYHNYYGTPYTHGENDGCRHNEG
jgi:hypothetical protein